MKLVKLTPKTLAQYRGDMEELSKGTPCPLGHEWYYTSYGKEYFSYFMMVGEPYLYGIVDKDKLVASVMIVLRTLEFKGKKKKLWYICDFKVHPSYRDKTLSPTMFKSEFLLNYLKAPRGFAVFINRKTEPSRVLTLAEKFQIIPISKVAELNNYFITAEELKKASEDFAFYKTSFKSVSLKERKDLFLISSKARINLEYLRFNQGQMDLTNLDPTLIFNFWLPNEDPLNVALKRKGIEPNTTASIVAHNMADFDWSSLNSDQI